MFSCFFNHQRIRLAFAFLSVGEDVSFMSIYFFAFNPLKRFRLAFSFLCVGEDVFIHFFTGAAPPPICNEGAPSKRAPKAISQGISLRGGEDICIVLIIVIAIVIIQKHSVKAEQRGSREAQKLKSKREAKAEENNQQEKNNKQSKQGRAASESLKREKPSRQSEKQKIRKAREAEKRKSREAEKQKSRGKQKHKMTNTKTY